MREASYNSLFASKLERDIGGEVQKISDRSSLGLPDSFHYMGGIVTFFEVKVVNATNAISLYQGKMACKPWEAVNDIRQFEVCRRMNKNATVLYVIYYTASRTSAVIPLELLEKYNRKRHADCLYYLQKGQYFVDGHGVDAFHRILLDKKKEIYDRLCKEVI